MPDEKEGELVARISFQELFMLNARFAAARSKDPRTTCGACIVHDNKPVGTGYNGFTKGMSDDPEIWNTDRKYVFVEHAERNAIYNSDRSRLNGSHIYIWTNRNYPSCPDCTKAIIQNGIKRVCFHMREEDMVTPPYFDWSDCLAMYNAGEVQVCFLGLDMEDVLRRATCEKQL